MNLALIRKPLLAGILVSVGLAGAQAQTNHNITTGVDRMGTPLAPEKEAASDGGTAANLRADRPERPDLPPEVLARIDHFKQDAREFLKRREAIEKQLAGANDAERDLIRRQFDELHRQWREQQRELRKEFRERQAELRDKLPEYREVIESARDAAIQQVQAAQRDAQNRTRRGED